MSEPTIADFYALCDSAHREFFSAVIYEWDEAGLARAWCDHAVGLAVRSVAKGGPVVFFELHPGGGQSTAAIRIDTHHWHREIGYDDTSRFIRGVEGETGIRHHLENGVFSIESPGHLIGPLQRKVRDMVNNFGRKLPDKIAS